VSAKYDAAIIGGGPAGLAAAIALSRIGARCLVIDFKRPPIDKACGEGLMPDSLGALAALGVHLPAGFGVAFKGIRFNCKGHATAAAFPQGVGLGVQRTALHQLLYEHASNENIAFSWRSKVEILDGQRLIVRSDTTCDTIDCHWLIGADGQKSYVRQFFGFEEVGAIPPRVGFRRHFYCSAWSEMVEVYWSNIGQLFIGPVSADEICVAFLARSRSVKFYDALRAFPGVWERLAKATAGKLMGAPTTNRVLKRVALNKVALIGDASGSVDAATGEGMALSFRQAAA